AKKIKWCDLCHNDEKSIVGRRMLALIDIRLHQAFPEHQNHPLVVDLHDPLSNDGIASYKQFQDVYQLDVVQYQSGNSDKQHNFRTILLHLRDSESTFDDWRLLTTQFNEAIYILPQKVDVDEINISKLRSLNRPIARIHTVHTSNEVSKTNSDIAKGLEARLL
ncbi:5212_t:CDS:2, partial [Racocetra fulgida]